MQQDQRKKVIPFISRLVFYLKKKRVVLGFEFPFLCLCVWDSFLFFFFGIWQLGFEIKIGFLLFYKGEIKNFTLFFLKFLYVNDDCGNVCVGKT